MSELTPCNYCNLRRIKADARATGKQVTVVAAKPEYGFRGYDVFIHGAGEPPKEGKHVAWFMDLSEHCCC